MSARSVSNLSITISANTAQASAALQALSSQAKSTGRDIDRASGLVGGAVGSLIGGKFASAGGFLGGLFGGPTGIAIGALGGSMIDATLGAIASATKTGAGLLSEAVKEMVLVGAEYEMALTVFSNAVGSDRGGRTMVSELNNLAAATIFSSKTLMEQGRQIMGAGFAAKEVIPVMTKLALISQKSGLGEDGLSRLALAFGQIKQAGVLRGQELIQLNQVGVGTQQLATALGMAADQFIALKESGQISFGMIARAFNVLGTQAQTEAEKVMATFTGRFNAVKDIGLRVFGEIGLGIIQAFKLPEALNYIASFLQELPAKAAALKPTLEGIRDVLMPIGQGLYAGLSAAFTAGSSFLGMFLPKVEDMKQGAKDFGSFLAGGIGKAIDLTIKLGKILLGSIQKFAIAFDMIAPYITDVKLPSMAKAVTRGMAGLTKAAMDAGPGGWQRKALQQYAAGFPSMTPFNPAFNQGGIDEGQPGLPAAVKDLARSIKEGFAEGKIGGPVRDFQTNMANLRMAEGAGLLKDNRAAADQFILNQFKTLTDSFKATASQLPKAIDMNTVAGQEQFERVMMNLRDQNKDVPTILRDILRVNQEQSKKASQTVDELRKMMQLQPIRVGGF